MSNATEEIVRLCESLPPEKRAEVVDFARFLLSQAGESPGDAAWERRVIDTRPLPKLDAFLRDAAVETR